MQKPSSKTSCKSSHPGHPDSDKNIYRIKFECVEYVRILLIVTNQDIQMNTALENKKSILAKIDKLTPAQQEQVLSLIESLYRQLQTNDIEQKQPRKWQEIRGKAPYPLVNEDAQNWVSRNRNEESKNRDLNLGNIYEY